MDQIIVGVISPQVTPVVTVFIVFKWFKSKLCDLKQIKLMIKPDLQTVINMATQIFKHTKVQKLFL